MPPQLVAKTLPEISTCTNTCITKIFAYQLLLRVVDSGPDAPDEDLNDRYVDEVTAVRQSTQRNERLP